MGHRLGRHVAHAHPRPEFRGRQEDQPEGVRGRGQGAAHHRRALRHAPRGGRLLLGRQREQRAGHRGRHDHRAGGAGEEGGGHRDRVHHADAGKRRGDRVRHGREHPRQRARLPRDHEGASRRAGVHQRPLCFFPA